MAGRPKSSMVGLGDAVLDLYSANQLRKMGSEFDSLRRSQQRDSAITLRAISDIAELQVATMVGIRELSTQLSELSKISWSIASYFERQEAREDFIGDLKLILIKFEDELDSIDELAEEYTEYASLQAEAIKTLVEENDVRIEHFKTLPPDDIKWAKSILERIDSTLESLMRKLSQEGD